MYVTTIVIQLF